jgi:hypothetical protein
MILPSEVVVGQMTYTLRKFQSGPGHDWLRKTPGGPGTHRSANAEVNQLVDEIVRLRALIPQPGDLIEVDIDWDGYRIPE